MTENKLSFEEFETLLINTINKNYINVTDKYIDISCNTINDYIQIYKLMKKNKDKNKIEKLEKEIELIKILCGIIVSISIIKLFI